MMGAVMMDEAGEGRVVRDYPQWEVMEFAGLSPRTLHRLVKSGVVDAPLGPTDPCDSHRTRYSLNALRQCFKASELKRQGFSYADQMRWLQLRKKRGSQKLKGLKDYLDTGDESNLTDFSKDDEKEFEELNGQLELLREKSLESEGGV